LKGYRHPRPERRHLSGPGSGVELAGHRNAHGHPTHVLVRRVLGHQGLSRLLLLLQLLESLLLHVLVESGVICIWI
jgi:hypothetical protein